MNNLLFLFFSTLFIINISALDIVNLYSSYINPKICNKSFPNDISCYYEINIWHYVPDNINKIYFFSPSYENSIGINFYYGKIINNELSDIKLIDKNRENIYEIKKQNKLYVVFIEQKTGYIKLSIQYFYSDSNNSEKKPKKLQLSYYNNYPIELVSEPSPQSCLSFYDYDNDPNKIYLISNNNYFIYYINSNSSSINYNTNNLQYFDQYHMNNNYDYRIYKNGNYYYIISNKIFIKIERNDDLLILTDISSNNEKFNSIKNDANVYNLEQIKYSNNELLHLYFKYSDGKVCSMEYGCSDPSISGTMTYISFYFNGECFIVKDRKEIYRCSFKPNNVLNMELLIGNKINNNFFDNEEDYYIYEIRIFPLDDNNSKFLLCLIISTDTNALFCIVFNYNSIENDLNTKKIIKIFDYINEMKSVKIYPYRSNKITNSNLFAIAYINEYSIIDIDNNICITGQQQFKSNYINKDTSFFDLGNNKYILTYSTGTNNMKLNIGLDMGTIPKSKKLLKVVENYQEYLEIKLIELYDKNEKLSNENYKVIFIKPIFDSEDINFNSNNIKFYYKNTITNLNFYDDNNFEYEINSNEDPTQKIIIKLSDSTFNILLNYTIIGEQLASKNLLKIMNKPKCYHLCSTCNYEYSHLADVNNHYCEKCDINYEYFLTIENNGRVYNNCYTNCNSQNFYYISGEKQCYNSCPNKARCYIKNNYECFSECPNDYYHYENNFECDDNCEDNYFMDKKYKKCTQICPEEFYGDEISKICVDICPENYYKDQLSKKCTIECPSGYYGDNVTDLCLKICENGFKLDIRINDCIPVNEPLNSIIDLNINDDNECIKSVIDNYKNLTDPKNIYQCNNLKIQIFASDNNSIDISKEISQKNNMTYLDINNCLDYIVNNNENINSKNDLIIIIIESQIQNTFSENFMYYVYDLNNNKINLQICKDNNIPISILRDTFLNELEMNLIKYYKDKYSIDITNSNEECFNNICTSLETEEGLDITMEYRRTKILINNICGNSEYEINYKQSKINCKMTDFKDNFEESKYTKILNDNNKLISDLRNSNINIIKCYKYVFEYSKAIKNKANWIILCLFIIKSFFFFVYLFTSITSIETFLQYWQIFKDTNITNGVISNNNFIQTLQTENNELTTKRKLVINNKVNKRDIKNNHDHKNNILESLSIESVNIKKPKNKYNNNNNDNNSAAPPKKTKNENNKKKKIFHKNNNNNINTNINNNNYINKKKEEKEYVFEKVENINYNKYIDLDDDVISDGCFPVVIVEAEKALKRQEEERKKKRRRTKKKKRRKKKKKRRREKKKKRRKKKKIRRRKKNKRRGRKKKVGRRKKKIRRRKKNKRRRRKKKNGRRKKEKRRRKKKI